MQGLRPAWRLLTHTDAPVAAVTHRPDTAPAPVPAIRSSVPDS